MGRKEEELEALWQLLKRGSQDGARTGWDGTGWWQRGGGVPLILGYF